jgi:DNA ligase (NAD+)
MRISKKLIAEISNNPNLILSFEKKDIEKVIKYLEDKYHNGESIVSDEIYDLIKELVKDIIVEQNVGALPRTKKVKLPYWMGSMDKLTKNANIERFQNKNQGEYTASDKLDGISAMFIVSKKDKLKALYTRGNGEYGQDISHIIKYIKNIPNVVEDVIIRGELVIKKENFKKIQHLGANARNMVSGCVNSKTVNQDIIKYVDFVGYTLIKPSKKPSLQKEWATSKGIQFVDQINKVKQLNEESLSKILMDRREHSEYEIDGIIVTHDKENTIEAGKNPTYAFAFKNISLLETKETTVLDVEWNISKDGYIKPIVIFTPVQLSGVTIKKATGFNAGFIKENMIGPGSIITITRSGDVIPYIKDVVKKSVAKMPTDINFTWNDTMKEIIMVGDSDEQSFKMLEHFYSKIKIKWLSTGTLRKLFNVGYITPYSIYSISKDDLSKVIGNIMAEKIVLERSATFKTIECSLLMDASNMFGRGFGEKRLEMIVSKIPMIHKGYKPTLEELIKIDGISSITGNQFISGMEKYLEFIAKNPFNCNKMPVKELQTTVIKSNILENKKIIFTGFRNTDVEKFIIENGGTIAKTFNKNVDYLIVKNDEVSNKKTELAKEWQIIVYTLESFIKTYKIKNI